MKLSLLPWAVRDTHRGSHLHRMLERESLLRDGLPCGTQEEIEELEAWKANLARSGAVVDYRADTVRGFFLVHARADVDDDLIRRPE